MSRTLVIWPGERYGHWLVLSRAPNRGVHTRWYVTCDCGTGRVLTGDMLSGQKSRSCGCSPRDVPHPKNLPNHRPDHFKLTPRSVRAIVGRLARGESPTAIAQRSGVTPAQICQIRRGRSWSSITGITRK